MNPIESGLRLWEGQVFEKYEGVCANDKDTQALRARMIVPLELGGTLSPDNGVLLCRSCRLRAAIDRAKESDTKSPISFFVPMELALRMEARFKTGVGYSTKASLVRFLVSQYVEDPDSYKDLVTLAGESPGDVKWNLWIETQLYLQFKEVLSENYTSSIRVALCGLITLYDLSLFGQPTAAEGMKNA